MNALVNANAAGVWEQRVGRELEVVGTGANPMHVEVRYPGESKTFYLPSTWLTMKETS